MIISSPFYIGREEVKEFLGVQANTRNERMSLLIAAVSRFIETRTGRLFYPTTATKKFDYADGTWLEFPYDDLLSLTSVADYRGTGSISLSNVLYEPVNSPPYDRIMINPQNDSFAYDDFPEQSITVIGEWGYCSGVVDSGATCPDLTASATSMAIANGSKLDVGWLLKIEDERIFISNLAAAADSTINTTAALNDYETDIGVGTAASFSVGEVIRIDDEEMKILRVDTSSLAVARAYNGTVAASHLTAKDVYVFRTFTIERGKFGSTAATHATGKAISRYVPPADIVLSCGILVARATKRSDSGWSDMSTIGGEGMGRLLFTKAMPVEVAAILDSYNKNMIGDI